MKLEVFDDVDSVARQAAATISADARSAINARGRYAFAVSGGHTPWIMLRATPSVRPISRALMFDVHSA